MISFEYENFNKKGLAKIVKEFEKNALPVSEVKGDNKPVRLNGFQTKTALILFESGQKLEIKAKLDGGIFSWKLNSKVLAIKNYMQLDTAMKEVVSYVRENEPNYQKQKEKQLAKVKVAVPAIKPVNTTVAEQTAAFQTNLEELAGQNEALNSQITEAENQVDVKRTELDALQVQIAEEQKRSTHLESLLENAKQGIFESASSDELPIGTKVKVLGRKHEGDAEFSGKVGTITGTGKVVGEPGKFCYSVKIGEEVFTQIDPAMVVKKGIFGSIFESGDAVAAICPECGATMDECGNRTDGVTGMECPECGCKTDSDGMVMESTNIDGSVTCEACRVQMESCSDGFKCPECGQISAADGTVMESGCKKKKDEEGEGE